MFTNTFSTINVKFQLLIAILGTLLVSAISYAEVSLDGTLGRSGPLAGPNYLITPELGQQVGSNLFHSFKNFGLSQHESATFSGPNNVTNLISRVTGGNPSHIDGTLRSTIPNANLYFLNPYGIMFGPNAKLDLLGSFHASTADTLHLQDGGQFNARQPNNSLLTVAPVEAFGFLTDAPAPISLQDSQLSVLEGQTLSLIGGDLRLDGEPPISAETGLRTFNTELLAPFGRLNLASVASRGEVIPTSAGLDISAETQPGYITAQNTQLSVNGKGGGEIYIRGGQFYLNQSAIRSDTLGDQNGKGIDIRVDSLELENSSEIGTDTSGKGNGGSVTLKVAGDLTVSGKSSISATSGNHLIIDTTLSPVTVNANNGDIDIEARQIKLKEFSGLLNFCLVNGQCGTITIVTDQLKLEKVGFIIGFTWGSGEGSPISIKTDVLTLSESMISSNSLGGTETSSITNCITTGTCGAEPNLRDNSLILKKLRPFLAIIGISEADLGISADSIGIQEAVTILLTFPNNLSPGHLQGAETHVGDAGNIEIEANQITLNNSAIDSGTWGSGKAGTIELVVDNLTLEKEAFIGSATFGSGDGGRIVIKTDALSLSKAGITTTSLGGTGSAGNIEIKAHQITLREGGIQSETFLGKGGTIKFVGDNLILENGAFITSSTGDSGKGGTIVINVSDAVTISNSYIDSFSGSKETNAGNAGEIQLQAKTFHLNHAVISTKAENADGGHITVTTPNLLYLREESAITTDVKGGDGDGGNITIKKPTFVVLDGAEIITKARRGFGGDITIDSEQFLEAADANNVLDASSEVLERSGTIVITAPEADFYVEVVGLSSNFLNQLLQESCVSRDVEKISHFEVQRGQLPPPPDDLKTSLTDEDWEEIGEPLF